MQHAPADARAPAVPPGDARTAPATQADQAAAEGSAMGADVATPWVLPPASGRTGVDGAQGASGADTALAAMSREERRQRRAQLRARLAQLQAKGPKAGIEDIRQALEEVERLGAGILDPRYFKAVRDMLGHAARADALSAELRQIGQSRKPQDLARQQVILAELREIGQRLSTTSQALQSYAPARTGGKP